MNVLIFKSMVLQIDTVILLRCIVCLSAGAGKTTLMDVLAGRKTAGTITGDVWVGGYPKDQHTFARVCGYVEQTDIHSPRVRECNIGPTALGHMHVI